MDAGCLVSSLWFGTLDGEPVTVVSHGFLGRIGTQQLVARQWQGAGWGAACTLGISHTVQLLPDGAFLAPGADAAGLAALAMRLVEDERATPPSQALPGDYRLTLPEEIPRFGDTDGNPYNTFQMALGRHLMHAGQPLFAVIGEGSFGWRGYDGRLVGFWRETPAGREPLAGFRIRFGAGPVRAFSVQE